MSKKNKLVKYALDALAETFNERERFYKRSESVQLSAAYILGTSMIYAANILGEKLNGKDNE